jgi:hypothetical protein
MTGESVSPDEPAEKRRRSWNLALLTPTEPGRRNRRTLRGWSSRLDDESDLFEHPDGAVLPALEISGGKALAEVSSAKSSTQRHS